MYQGPDCLHSVQIQLSDLGQTEAEFSLMLNSFSTYIKKISLFNVRFFCAWTGGFIFMGTLVRKVKSKRFALLVPKYLESIWQLPCVRFKGFHIPCQSILTVDKIWHTFTCWAADYLLFVTASFKPLHVHLKAYQSSLLSFHKDASSLSSVAIKHLFI